MELFERIRHDHEKEGLGVRALAHRHRVHRRTVRQALASAMSRERKAAEGALPRSVVTRGLIRQWLTDDLEVPRKQRHTPHRIWVRPLEEQGATVAESTVRAHVAQVHFRRTSPRPPSPWWPAEQTKMGYFEFLDAVLEEEVETPGGTLRMSEASWLPTAFAASLRDYVNRYRASGWP